MTAFVGSAAAAVATIVFWSIAAGAAGRRHMQIGTLPRLLPPVTAALGCAAVVAGFPPPAIAAGAGAAVAAVVDARTGAIFDPLTAAMLVATSALEALRGSFFDGLSGAAGVGGALFFLHAVSSGRGLGLGDVKLGAALGMGLGLSNGLTATVLAFVLGGGYGTWLLATGRARAGAPIRFGPFLALGTCGALLAPFAVHA